MPKHIKEPTIISAHGLPPKKIEEYIGRVNTKNENISIARMVSPQGWAEPGQRPEFDEYTIVLKGKLKVECESGMILTIAAGEALITKAGEWVRYSSPDKGGAEYIAICLPAFSPDTVNRDED